MECYEGERTTSGSYGASGSQQTTRLTRDYSERESRRSDTWELDSDWFFRSRSRSTLNIHESDGQPSGHGHEYRYSEEYGLPPSTTNESFDPFEGQDPSSASGSRSVEGGPVSPGTIDAPIEEVSAQDLRPSSGGFWSVPDVPLDEPESAPAADAHRPQQEGLLGRIANLIPGVHNFKEWRRGVDLDKQLRDLQLQQAQKEMAVNPTSGQGLRQLQAIQQEQRRQAAGDARAFAEFGIHFNAAGFGGAFAAPVKSFGSFDALKRSLGPAGKGKVWHHIVEQRAPNVQRFGAEAIHNTRNVVAVPQSVNQKIADFYSSKRSFTGGQTVRTWLDSQSFAEQDRFGRRILDAVLNEQPLPR